MQRYSRDTSTCRSPTITRIGGDMQASVVIDGVLYASCHCVNYLYTDTNDYDGGPAGAFSGSTRSPTSGPGTW